jgi:hypothetical protein
MIRNRPVGGRRTRATSWSRRQFLGQSSALIGATLILPFGVRFARAQSTTFDFYISPTGSDSNPGTANLPWALTALNTRQSTYAGRRVGVLPGTYDCLALVGGKYAPDFAIPAFNIAGGTAASPTIVQSTVPQGAILDGGANASNNSAGQPIIGTYAPTVGSGYLVIDGFEVTNSYNRAISVGTDVNAGARAKGVVVQNCYVHKLTNEIQGANPTGITVYGCDGAVVQNNFVSDFLDTSSRACGIEYWTSINCVTQFNTVVSTNSQFTIGIAHKNVAQDNDTVRFNFIDMSATGANGVRAVCIDSDGDGTTTTTVNNNIMISDLSASPALIDTGNFPSSLDNQVWFNNTFVGIPNNSVGAFVRFGAPGTISFYNNVISRGTTGGRGDLNTNVSALKLLDYNCYPAHPVVGLTADGQSGYPIQMLTSLQSMLAGLASSIAGRDAHSLGADPMFVGTGSGPAAYQLKATSPCRNRGSTTGTPSGEATDMGAWGNGATQVGCDFAHQISAVAAYAAPQAPKLTSVR